MTERANPQSTAPIDRATFRRQRERAGIVWREYYDMNSIPEGKPDPEGPDFLVREVAARLCDRLLDFNRSFETALDIGCHLGQISEALPPSRIDRLYACDYSETMVRQGGALTTCFVADEESLPIASQCMDLIVSCLDLQWVNDLPGCLAQIRQALKPDGLFLAAIIGGDSLTELRKTMLVAESEISGGVSPRILPMIDIRDAGALLQRAGFALPVVDVDEITFQYPDPFALMKELRGLGWQNALTARRRNFTGRTTFERMAELYFRDFANPNGGIPATFQILYLTAWAPHESQQKPLKPGSGNMPLGDALDIENEN